MSEQVQLQVLWARHPEGHPSAPYPQFVAAFTEGEVDYWPEMYRRRRAEAEDWYSDFGRLEGEAKPLFFTTWETVQRPPNSIGDPLHSPGQGEAL